VPLPYLQGRRGVWVVEVIGGGRTCRAVLRCGHIRCVERLGAAGHQLTLLYEDNTPVQGARVLASGREYSLAPGKPPGSELLVPYHSESGRGGRLVLGDDKGFAVVLGNWRHETEQYSLQAGFYLEREAAAAGAGSTAPAAAGGPAPGCPLLVAASLSLHGWPAPLSLLSDVTLEVETLDAAGTSSKQSLPDFKLAEGGKAAVHMVRVPERCVTINVKLSGRVRKVQPGPDGGPAYADVEAKQSWQLNTSELLPRSSQFVVGPNPGDQPPPATSDAHLTLNPDGTYTLVVLGRAGEVVPQMPVQLTLRHAMYEQDIEAQVVTDERGEVALGRLEGVVKLQAALLKRPGAGEGEAGGPPLPAPCSGWLLRGAGPVAGGQRPEVINVVGRPDLKVHVACQHSTLQYSGSCRLLQYNRTLDHVTIDLTASHLQLAAAAAEPGTLLPAGAGVVLVGLPVGEYVLILAAEERMVEVLVAEPPPPEPAAGAVHVLDRGLSRFVLPKTAVVEAVEEQELQLVSVESGQGLGIRVQLSGSKAELAATTLHLALMRFYPYGQEGSDAQSPAAALQVTPRHDVNRHRGRDTGAVPACNLHESNRAMPQELRYVMERRQLVKEGKIRPSVQLDRPSLLVHPWMSGDTHTDKLKDQADDLPRSRSLGEGRGALHRKCMAAPRGMAMQASMCAMACDRNDLSLECGRGGAPPPSPTSSLGLLFCPKALVIPNVQVDPTTGIAHVPAEVLSQLRGQAHWWEGLRLVRVVATSARSGAAAEALLPLQAAAGAAGRPVGAEQVVGAMLERPFGAGTPCMEILSSTGLPPGKTLVIADSGSAKLRLVGSLGAAWSLFGALLGADAGRNDPCEQQHYATFKFIGQWGGLSLEAKQKYYMEHACRELDFFLLHHDFPLFSSWVLPLLRSRLPTTSTFLDEWMVVAGQAAAAAGGRVPGPGQWGDAAAALGSKWGQPDRYSSLNALEAVLLEGCTAGGPAAVSAALRRLAADIRAEVRARGRFERDWERRRLEVALSAGEDALDPEASGVLPAAAVAGGPPPLAAAPMPPPAAMYGMMRGGAPAPRMLVDMEEEELDMDLMAVEELKAAPVYRAAPQTKQWSESGWYRRPASVSPQTICPQGLVWAEFAEHMAAAVAGGSPIPPFVPNHLHLTARSFSDAMLALAVLGLPWEERPPAATASGTRLELQAAAGSALAAFVRQTQPAATAATAAPAAAAAGGSPPPLVLLQSIIDPLDRPRRGGSGGLPGGDGAEEMEEDDEADEGGAAGPWGGAPVTGPLVAGRVYAVQVTVTSGTATPLFVDVTVQAPQGSVPLGGRPSVWTSQCSLGAFQTDQMRLYFYFPRPGLSFGSFPAAAARKGKLLAVARDVAPHLPVLDKAPPAEHGSASRLSLRQLCAAPPSPAADTALLTYLAEARDLASQDLRAIRWRLRDAAFFKAVCGVLRSRRTWRYEIWEYSLLHRDPETVREYVASSSGLTWRLGPVAETPLISRQPWAGDAAGAPAYAEFWPLVNPRVHELGGRQAVLNEQLRESWQALLAVLARRRAALPHELLQAACLLVAMERLEEAEAILQRAEQQQQAGAGWQLPAWQVLYLRCWLLLAAPVGPPQQLAARLQEAARQAEQEAASPAAAGAAGAAAAADTKWRERWDKMAGCLREAAAVARASAGSAGLADMAVDAPGGGVPAAAVLPPSLLLQEDAASGGLVVEVTSLSQISISVYEMDTELLFSSHPFSSAAAGSTAGTKAGGQAAAGGNFAFVKPSHSATVQVPGAGAAAAAALPAGVVVLAGSGGPLKLAVDLSVLFPSLQRTASVLVEVSGGGLVSRQALFRAGLVVRLFEASGVLQVTERATGVPVVAAYVKAYSAPPELAPAAPVPPGSAKFHKDGYTDRCGRFDYFTLTAGGFGTKYGRLAVLVVHPELGSTVSVVIPPPH